MSAQTASEKMPSGLGSKAREWLEARGLDSELCEKQGLASRPSRDGASEVLIIPFEKDGRIVNRKYRDLAEKRFSQVAGGEQIFWRRDVLKDAGLADQPLVITEGEMDALAAIQAGFWRTVSVPAGAPNTPLEGRGSAKYGFLDDARIDLDPIKEIILAVDGDGPGTALLSDLTSLLGPARCRFVSYPPGCKDLNDVLREKGAADVKRCLDEARWVNVAGVYKLSDLPPLPDLKIWRPNIHKPIDKIIPICPGHISFWTGIAGHGKSTLLNAVMWSIADKEGVKIAHGAFESTPQREYLQDFIAFHTGFPVGDVAQSKDKIMAARDWVEDHIVFLNSDGYAAPKSDEWIDATLDWFINAATTAVVRHGCRIIILDPWSQIDHERENHEREDEYIRRALKRLKIFARAFDVHVAVVAHPTKPHRDKDGLYVMPEGYEISGAAHWYNFADLGVTVHRDPPIIDLGDGERGPDPKSSRVLIRVWKVKFHRVMNPTGDAYASLQRNTGRYVSAESWD